MNIQAEFDQLFHHVATTVNKVLADAADPVTGYLCDEQGKPIQIFQKIASDGYTKNANGEWEFVTEKPGVSETYYTISNLQINQELLQQPTRLGFVKADGSVDFETMEKLKAAFLAEEISLNPTVKKKSSILDYYSDLVSQVANSGAVYNSILTNQQETVDATFSAREQIIGVSQDEELNNMIRFQNAYNASSRYINVIDQMLEHILSTLGR